MEEGIGSSAQILPNVKWPMKFITTSFTSFGGDFRVITKFDSTKISVIKKLLLIFLKNGFGHS